MASVSHPRVNQVVLLVSMSVISWLGMMLVHELGHVIGAWATGGTVQRVVWHPLAISRTDVSPNPSPLVVVWMGPIVGIVLPVILAGIATALRLSIAYLMTFFAGFCFLANGAYIGIGCFERIGDAGDMIRLGSPPWLLIVFGIVAGASGLLLWHLISPKLGFGKSPQPVLARHAYGSLVVALATVVLGFAVGS